MQALSRSYVQKRGALLDSALRTAGKRAGFALFYAPLHFILLREICRALEISSETVNRIIDLGCGTGVSGAAWALEAGKRPELVGVDRNSWALDEAAWTYRTLGLRGRRRCSDIDGTPLSGARSGIVAAFAANELGGEERERVRGQLLDAASRGAAVLVVEPVARRLTPWWGDWARAFCDAGARADEWRFRPHLPERLRLMDKAAGLDHSELTGKSLWIAPGRA